MVEVEEKTAHVLVIDFPSSVSFFLGYHLHPHTHTHHKHTSHTHTHLSAVFADKLVLLCPLLDEDAPPRHVRGSQQQVLPVVSLYRHILTVAHHRLVLQTLSCVCVCVCACVCVCVCVCVCACVRACVCV